VAALLKYDHADTLRTVGRVLELEGGSAVELVRFGSSLVVWWHAEDHSRHERRYEASELERLPETGRRLRGASGGGVASGLSEALRTLGQDLDTIGADTVGIVQDDDAFFVTASSDQSHLMRTYLAEEVLRLSQVRRRSRNARGYLPPVP
jgi:hypothetical protein